MGGRFQKTDSAHMKRTLVFSLLLLSLMSRGFAQDQDSIRLVNQRLDSIFISEVEERKGPLKLLHAEPLFIDLIRDLGARKGEREWNIGMGLADHRNYDSYEFLVEYEWAPIDRLGLEVELPLMINRAHSGFHREDTPGSKLESIKVAAQYTFLVSDKAKTSMAFGYINELLFTELKNFGNPVFRGNLYNPFLIAAKRWGTNYHTLVYTGPRLERHFGQRSWELEYEWHTNFHYMIPGTRNFIGVETNKYIRQGGDLDITIRPQIRVGIAENFLIGLVTGIPVARESESFSMFTRIIWEPFNHK
jgi:hypothetical protein